MSTSSVASFAQKAQPRINSEHPIIISGRHQWKPNRNVGSSLNFLGYWNNIL